MKFLNGLQANKDHTIFHFMVLKELNFFLQFYPDSIKYVMWDPINWTFSPETREILTDAASKLSFFYFSLFENFISQPSRRDGHWSVSWLALHHHHPYHCAKGWCILMTLNSQFLIHPITPGWAETIDYPLKQSCIMIPTYHFQVTKTNFFGRSGFKWEKMEI